MQSSTVVFVELISKGSTSGAFGEEAEHANSARSAKIAKKDLTARIVSFLVDKVEEH
ncbi:hypothetical protein HUU05_24180 [candidate division KSB1 bacterium]|nr:hypothetical protein [candidate division KSB1 bacterium]